MMRPTPLLVLALAASSLASAAVAHAMLEKADPRVGSRVEASPSEIRLQFSEPVEPRLSRIELRDEAGHATPIGPATTDPKQRRVLVARLGQRLAPGRYRVSWRVVSIDSHRSQGDFSFTIGRP